MRYILCVSVGIFFAKAKGAMMSSMRQKMFALLISQDMQFYDDAKAGELLDRLKRDPETLENFINHSLEKVFIAMIDLLSGLFMVWNYRWYLWAGSISLKVLPVSIRLRAGKLVSTYQLVQRHR